MAIQADGPVEHSYTLTFQDYVRGLRLFSTRSAWRRLRYEFTFVILPILASLPIAVVVFAKVTGRAELFAAFSPFALSVGWLVISVPAVRQFRRRKGFSNMLHPGDRDVTAAISFDQEGIRVTESGRSESHYSWDGILEFAEDGEMALILVQKQIYFPIPTRAMAAARWAELRTLMSTHGVKVTQC